MVIMFLMDDYTINIYFFILCIGLSIINYLFVTLFYCIYHNVCPLILVPRLQGSTPTSSTVTETGTLWEMEGSLTAIMLTLEVTVCTRY